MAILKEIFLLSKSKLGKKIAKDSQLTAKMKRSLKFKKLLTLILIRESQLITTTKASTNCLISA